MGFPRPELLDTFRLCEGRVADEIYEKRRFSTELWEQMNNGKIFTVDIGRGYYESCDPGKEPFAFPMNEYLLSRDNNLLLPQLLGPDVKIITQRTVLRDLIAVILGQQPRYSDNIRVFCERFGDIIFIKEDAGLQTGRGPYENYGHYLDLRMQFFTGDDVPDCVGTESALNFRFPEVGCPYEVLSLDYKGTRIVYTGNIRHFAPDDQIVASVLVNAPDISEAHVHKMVVKSMTSSSPASVFFRYDKTGKRLRTDFFNLDEFLATHGSAYEAAINTACEILLGQELKSFLSIRRCCAATLELSPTLRFRPETIPNTYQSFLFKDFFHRFFDD